METKENRKVISVPMEVYSVYLPLIHNIKMMATLYFLKGTGIKYRFLFLIDMNMFFMMPPCH